MPRRSDGFSIGTESEEELAFRKLFPAHNRFQDGQIFTEITNRMRAPLAAIGTIRRLYEEDYYEDDEGKKVPIKKTNFNVLTTWQEEFNITGHALDRKAKLEGAEIVAAVRTKRENDED